MNRNRHSLSVLFFFPSYTFNRGDNATRSQPYSSREAASFLFVTISFWASSTTQFFRLLEGNRCNENNEDQFDNIMTKTSKPRDGHLPKLSKIKSINIFTWFDSMKKKKHGQPYTMAFI